MRPRQNGHQFPDENFRCIFLNENIKISIKISLKFVPKRPINNVPALVQIMAWRRRGDKSLSEPLMVSLLMHICVTASLGLNELRYYRTSHRYITLYSSLTIKITLKLGYCPNIFCFKMCIGIRNDNRENIDNNKISNNNGNDYKMAIVITTAAIIRLFM